MNNLLIEKAQIKYGARTILDVETLEISSGVHTVILGPNGCGKTSLIKYIVGNCFPSAREERKFSYVPQDTYGSLNLTTRDIVSLGRYNPKKFFASETKEDREAIDEAIEEMELGDLLERNVDTLSGGERQRVMIARALAQNAEWNFLDEPTSSLDIKYSELLMRVIRSRVRRGQTFVTILHDINLASINSDEVILMREGRIDSCGASSEVLTIHALERAYDTRFSTVAIEGKSVFVSGIDL